MSEPLAACEQAPDIPTRIRTGLIEGLRTAWKIILISVPLYVVVSLFKRSDFMVQLGDFFAPYMGVFGLPGETAVAFVASGLLSPYAGVAVIVPLGLDSFQLTQCGVMMGIAHNLVVEGGVLSSTGTRGITLTLCRVGLAVVAGLLLHGLYFIWRFF